MSEATDIQKPTGEEPVRTTPCSAAPVEGAGWRRVHMSLSVRGALRNRSFDWFTKDDGSTCTKEEGFNYLCDKLAAGWEKLPIGDCDNFDPKTGCRGHAGEQPDAGDERQA